MATPPPRIVYVDTDLPGITRRRAGKGWNYSDPKGQRIADRAEIDRLNAIALPPAYRDAWYCPAGNGHILATGIDERGRKQYRYHPDFRSWRESEKFDACLAFGKLLPLLRRQVAEDMGLRGLGKRRAVASLVRLLDLGCLRIGNECYARENKSFGATTLRRRHVEVVGERLQLRFRAKSGKERELEITDRRLARYVRSLQDLRGQRLFRYVDDDGSAHPVSSCDVNDYLREIMGADFTAKNFRTWHASEIAFEALVNAAGQVPISALAETVSERLGNTPAIARKSYIHPAVIARVEGQEEWRAGVLLPRATRWLSREERGLLALLEEAPSAQQLLAA